MKWLVRAGTHLLAMGVGVVLGIYLLPLLIAPAGPSDLDVQTAATNAQFTAKFQRDLEDSDALHWGEGTVYLGPDAVSLAGRLAPGPDYRLYLSPQFVETEADFTALKAEMVELGPVRTFENFSVPIPAGVNPTAFTSVIVWCESFSQFITAAEYQ